MSIPEITGQKDPKLLQTEPKNLVETSPQNPYPTRQADDVCGFLAIFHILWDIRKHSQYTEPKALQQPQKR